MQLCNCAQIASMHQLAVLRWRVRWHHHNGVLLGGRWVAWPTATAQAAWWPAIRQSQPACCNDAVELQCLCCAVVICLLSGILSQMYTMTVLEGVQVGRSMFARVKSEWPACMPGLGRTGKHETSMWPARRSHARVWHEHSDLHELQWCNTPCRAAQILCWS